MVHTAGLTKWMCLAAAWLLGLAAAQAAPQQDDEKPSEPKAAESAEFPNVLKNGTLDLDARVYLLDSRNKPFFIPNMRFGDLLNLNRAQALRAEGGELPGYTIEEIKLNATAAGDRADIRAEIKVTLGDTALPVTEIPLRLQSCLISEAIHVDGPGKSQFQVGRNDQPGYTWWLRGEPNSTHVATLVGQSILQTEGDRQSIQITLPLALTNLELMLPPGFQDVRVRGHGGELVRDERIVEGRRVSVRCQGGDLNLSWRTSSDSRPVAGAAEATSKTVLRIDDPRQDWDAETELNLRAHGEAIVDSLIVDLPEGATWLPPRLPTEQFTISSESLPGKNADSKQRTRLTIRAVSRAGLAALDAISFRWTYKPGLSSDESGLSNVPIPNISVDAVDRHEGTTTLIVPASYGLEWKSQPGTDLIQQLRIGTIQEQFRYVFRFARQPQGLTVTFRREVNLPEVRPTYLVEIDRGKVKLTGWLKCAFDRSQPAELAIDLGDWKFAAAEALSDSLNPFAEGEPLSQTQLSDGVVKLARDLDAELVITRKQTQLWRFVAYRSLEKQPLQSLELSIPAVVLLATDRSQIKMQNATGMLMVTTTGSMSVSWDETRSRSILTDALAPEWTSALGRTVADRTLVYRYQSSDDQPPLWSGSVEVLPRRVAVQQTAQVKLDLDIARITQKLTLQIANEPLSKLQLLSHGSQQISVLVSGVPCVVEETLTVSGAPQLLGKVEVEIRSQVPLPQLANRDNSTSGSAGTSAKSGTNGSAELGTVVTLPLVQLDLPDAITRSPAQLSIVADRRLSVSAALEQSSSETGTANPSTEDKSDETWSSITGAPVELAAGQNEIDLLLLRVDQADPVPVRVSGAWLQTAITGTTRADRFCARFSTQQESISMRLNDPSAQVAIDGVQQNGVMGRVEINLRDLPAGSEHTLEVWTRSPGRLDWVTKVDVVPVAIDGCRGFDHFYWQLVLPSNQYLATVPNHLTAEWRWSWDRLWWRRTSSLDQQDFENWLGASHQQPLAESTNRYVVSSFGDIPSFRVWTVSRLVLWMPVGLFAIVCALLVSLWPFARHPASLIVLAACVLALSAVWPDLAIMLGQTSVLGLAIVLLYGMTQAAVDSRVRRRSVFTTRPSSILVETSDQHSLVRIGQHGSSEIMPTTRTQSPIVSEGGGHP